MREDQKDYSTNLNLDLNNQDFNNQDFEKKENTEDNNKIYNPPDINKIK